MDWWTTERRKMEQLFYSSVEDCIPASFFFLVRAREKDDRNCNKRHKRWTVKATIYYIPNFHTFTWALLGNDQSFTFFDSEIYIADGLSILICGRAFIGVSFIWVHIEYLINQCYWIRLQLYQYMLSLIVLDISYVKQDITFSNYNLNFQNLTFWHIVIYNGKTM